MKRMLVVILVCCVAYSAYWVVGSRGAQSGIAAWFKDRRGEGWQAEYADLTLRGFPNRFDSTLTAPVLADPDSGLMWQAPFLQLFALSYRPNHVIAVWPNSQRFATPTQTYDITSSDMRASLVLLPETNLPLDRVRFVSDTIEITSDSGARTALGGVQMAISRVQTTTQTYRFTVNADGLVPPLPAGLAVNTPLPDHLDTLRGDITVAFSRPWDITAISASRPQPTHIDLKLAEAKWGGLELQFAGTLDVDAAGQPSGKITVKARNWRDIVQLAVGLGWLPSGLAKRLEQGLSLASGLSGNAETLDIPLSFGGGLVSLGPIPIGPSPVLRLR